MYHYDPGTALEELDEDALLPPPVHLRDIILRAKLTPQQALDVNRLFQDYLRGFGELQELARPLLEKLAAAAKK